MEAVRYANTQKLTRSFFSLSSEKFLHVLVKIIKPSSLNENAVSQTAAMCCIFPKVCHYHLYTLGNYLLFVFEICAFCLHYSVLLSKRSLKIIDLEKLFFFTKYNKACVQ